MTSGQLRGTIAIVSLEAYSCPCACFDECPQRKQTLHSVTVGVHIWTNNVAKWIIPVVPLIFGVRRRSPVEKRPKRFRARWVVKRNYGPLISERCSLVCRGAE